LYLQALTGSASLTGFRVLSQALLSLSALGLVFSCVIMRQPVYGTIAEERRAERPPAPGRDTRRGPGDGRGSDRALLGSDGRGRAADSSGRAWSRSRHRVSDRLPAVTGKEVIKALEAKGWYLKRIRGSHHIMRHPAIPIPVHGNRALKIGTRRPRTPSTNVRSPVARRTYRPRPILLARPCSLLAGAPWLIRTRVLPSDPCAVRAGRRA